MLRKYDIFKKKEKTRTKVIREVRSSHIARVYSLITILLKRR